MTFVVNVRRWPLESMCAITFRVNVGHWPQCQWHTLTPDVSRWPLGSMCAIYLWGQWHTLTPKVNRTVFPVSCNSPLTKQQFCLEPCVIVSCPWQGCWRSGRWSHTSCTCRTTGAPGSRASSSSSPLACSSRLWQLLPSSPSSLLPSHRSNVILIPILYCIHECESKGLIFSCFSLVTQLWPTHRASISPVCGASSLSSGLSSWPCTPIGIGRSLQTSASSVIFSPSTL